MILHAAWAIGQEHAAAIVAALVGAFVVFCREWLPTIMGLSLMTQADAIGKKTVAAAEKTLTTIWGTRGGIAKLLRKVLKDDDPPDRPTAP